MLRKRNTYCNYNLQLHAGNFCCSKQIKKKPQSMERERMKKLITVIALSSALGAEAVVVGGEQPGAQHVATTLAAAELGIDRDTHVTRS